MYTALMILDGILSIAIIAAVVLQSGKSAGMSGAIAGGADTIFGGRKKGLDEVLSKATIFLGLAFGVVTLALAKMTM